MTHGLLHRPFSASAWAPAFLMHQLRHQLYSWRIICGMNGFCAPELWQRLFGQQQRHQLLFDEPTPARIFFTHQPWHKLLYFFLARHWPLNQLLPSTFELIPFFRVQFYAQLLYPLKVLLSPQISGSKRNPASRAPM